MQEVKQEKKIRNIVYACEKKKNELIIIIKWVKEWKNVRKRDKNLNV